MNGDVSRDIFSFEDNFGWFRWFFVFVVLLSVSAIIGVAVVVGLLLDHFGVLMVGVLL